MTDYNAMCRTPEPVSATAPKSEVSEAILTCANRAVIEAQRTLFNTLDCLCGEIRKTAVESLIKELSH